VFYRSFITIHSDLSSSLPPAVTILFTTLYETPAVPPLNHTVVVVVSFVSDTFVNPVGTVHELEEIVSLPSHVAQSNP
jgi:hypothetical protein